MVDDLDDFGLLKPRHGLADLVVVDKHDALAVGPQQVIARERAHNDVVFVEYGIAAVARLERGLLDVVEVVAQMECYDVLLRMADVGHRDGEEHHARGDVRVVGRADDACVAAVFV